MINSRFDETHNFLLSGFKEYQTFQLRSLKYSRFDRLSNQNTFLLNTAEGKNPRQTAVVGDKANMVCE